MSELVRARDDDGLATVLRALSAIDGLDALECREHGSNGDAYVLFRYGRSRSDLLDLVADLDPRMHAFAPGLRFLVEVESVGGGTELLARLAFPASSATQLASALRAARARQVTADR
jgi:hypothetical protein